MDIRIDYITDGPETVICIAGRLYSPAIPELKQACDAIEDPLVIDLSNLLFADEKGIDAIRAIENKGAQIQGASPFVQLLLDNAPERETNGEESKPAKNGFDM